MPKKNEYSWDPPPWLIDPEPNMAIFHNKNVEIYTGRIHIDSIKVWRENDRTSLDLEHLAKESGVKDVSKLNDDEIISYILKNGLHKITGLAKSIKSNGVRLPLTLTYNKELLDGNRRFIACKYLMNTEKEKDPKFEYIKVNCLKPNVSRSLRHKIISEMNFLPDFKEKWPREVRAKYTRKLFLEYKKKYGTEKAEEEISFLLDVDKADIYRFIEVLRMIKEYVKFAKIKSKEAAFEAQTFAREKFQFFEEFYNKNISKKDQEINKKIIGEDKKMFYEYLFDKQLISIYGIREFAAMLQYPSVRTIIKNKNETLEFAKAIYDDIVIPKRTTMKIEQFCKWLESLPKKEIKNIHQDVKERLLRTIERLK